MAKAKKTVEKPVEEVVDTTRENLEARQTELLEALDWLKANNFRDTGNIEVELSNVNRDLAAL